MDAALADLRSSNGLSISAAAKKYGVGRSALSRRFNLKAASTAQYHASTRLLNNAQEKELLKYIRRLCERCLPPTPRIVANIAQEICGEEPSKNWSTRFVARHKDQLDARYLNTLDLARHRADSKASYEHYFGVLSARIKKYDILPENMYNMDEKGFLIGRLQKTQRVFTKDLYKQGKLVGVGQDGSREWITVVATICADGTSLSPTLIYKAVSSNLRDTWLDDFEPSRQSCYFTSLPNGWTSDELGYSWLTGLFEEETAVKAKRSWRLLFVDGHGSHVNMKFLNWCERHRILIAIYPPHSTHRLQPLDVSVFAPLAHHYSQGLDSLIRQSEGRTTMSKRDFFAIFWPAFEEAFTEKNIASAWSKTGILPFDPQKVLSIFSTADEDTSGRQSAERPASASSSSTFDSPSKVKRIRTVLNSTVAGSDRKTQRTLEKLGDTVLGLSAKLTLSRLQNKQLDTALRLEQRKKKRQKRVFEELRSSEGFGTLIMSPTRIQRARDLAMRREQEKEQLVRDRELRTQERTKEKARKQEKAQRKREDREVASAARKTAAAEKKAARAKEKADKMALKQFENQSSVSVRRPRGRPKKQTATKVARASPVEPVVEERTKQPVTRRGRESRLPARYSD
jgi:hypothetical protein